MSASLVRIEARLPALAYSLSPRHGLGATHSSGPNPAHLRYKHFFRHMSQVETLRMYLEEALGGEDVFKRVYGYVLRDENGECEDVEEKEALHAYLGPQRKRLVPLVYTFAYMEDALSACGIAA